MTIKQLNYNQIKKEVSNSATRLNTLIDSDLLESDGLLTSVYSDISLKLKSLTDLIELSVTETSSKVFDARLLFKSEDDVRISRAYRTSMKVDINDSLKLKLFIYGDRDINVSSASSNTQLSVSVELYKSNKRNSLFFVDGRYSFSDLSVDSISSVVMDSLEDIDISSLFSQEELYLKAFNEIFSN